MEVTAGTDVPVNLVELVQQLYPVPLNPDVIRAASSITVVPVNSDDDPKVINTGHELNSGDSNPDDLDVIPISIENIFAEESDNPLDESCEEAGQFCVQVFHQEELASEVAVEVVEEPNKQPKHKWVNVRHYRPYKMPAKRRKKDEEALNQTSMETPEQDNQEISLNNENEITTVSCEDPTSKLHAMDESRSLLTQDYVFSVLAAPGCRLSYSTLEDIPHNRFKAAKSYNNPVLDSDHPSSDSISSCTQPFSSSDDKFGKVLPNVYSNSEKEGESIPEEDANDELEWHSEILSDTEIDDQSSHEIFTLESQNEDDGEINPSSGDNVTSPVRLTDAQVILNELEDESWQLPSNMCRICAKRSDSIEKIFSEKGEKLRIVDMIHTHLPIMVTPQDLLPLSVCRVCISRLQVADKLVKTCVDADSTLRVLLELVCRSPVPNSTAAQEKLDFQENPSAAHEDPVDASAQITSQELLQIDNLGMDQPDQAHSNEEQEAVPSGADGTTTIRKFGSSVKVKMVQEKVPLSQLLSEKDVTTIKEMKAEGLKVTLVRLPTLNNLSDRAKHKRVMQILKTLKTNPSLKKKKKKKSKTVVVAGPTLSSVTSAAMTAVSQDSPTVSALSPDLAEMSVESHDFTEISAFSRNRKPEILRTYGRNNMNSNCATNEDDLASIASDRGVEDSGASEYAEDASTSRNIQAFEMKQKNAFPDPTKLLKGFNPALVKGIDESGALIKLQVNQSANQVSTNDSAAVSSVYMYVRNSEEDTPLSTSANPANEIRQKLLAAQALKAAKKQASVMRLLAQRRERRYLQKMKRELRCIECNFTAANKEEITEHKLNHLKCQFCGKLHKSRVSLIEHERVHTKEKPYVCEHCGRSFRTKQQMQQHAQRHNPEKPYGCGICGRRFSVKTTFVAHVSRHNNESPWLCETCGKSFKLQAALRFHKMTHRTFSCNVCNKNLSYRAYRLHKRSHAGEAQFPCSVCDKRFLTLQRLKIHSLIHEATYPFSCGVCRRSFKRMTHLQAHRARHAEEHLLGLKFFCCAVCSQEFDEPSQLSQHIRTHSDEERQLVKAFKCHSCNKCFSVEHELRTHEYRHSGKQLFSCSICDLAFEQRKDFEEHSSSHVENKPFACDVCGKRFGALLNLNNHKQIHLSSKPFHCQFCPKAFKTVNGLNQHKLVHSDIRKHACALCNMSFKRRDAMKNHERTHFAERPYACSVCGRAFKVKADCSTHLKRHRESGIEGSVIESCYSCPVCGQTFTLKVDLSNHVQSTHSLDVAVLDIEQDDDSLLTPEVTVF